MGGRYEEAGTKKISFQAARARSETTNQYWPETKGSSKCLNQTISPFKKQIFLNQI
jgi:hypothetical protein